MKGPALNFKTKTLECAGCKTKQKLELPQALGAMSHTLSTFAHEHRDCAVASATQAAKP